MCGHKSSLILIAYIPKVTIRDRPVPTGGVSEDAVLSLQRHSLRRYEAPVGNWSIVIDVGCGLPSVLCRETVIQCNNKCLVKRVIPIVEVFLDGYGSHGQTPPAVYCLLRGTGYLCSYRN